MAHCEAARNATFGDSTEQYNYGAGALDANHASTVVVADMWQSEIQRHYALDVSRPRRPRQPQRESGHEADRDGDRREDGITDSMAIDADDLAGIEDMLDDTAGESDSFTDDGDDTDHDDSATDDGDDTDHDDVDARDADAHSDEDGQYIVYDGIDGDYAVDMVVDDDDDDDDRKDDTDAVRVDGSREPLGCIVARLAASDDGAALAWAVLKRLRPVDVIALARASVRTPRIIADIFDAIVPHAPTIPSHAPYSVAIESALTGSPPICPSAAVARVAAPWLTMVSMSALKWPAHPLAARLDSVVYTNWIVPDTPARVNKYVPAFVRAFAIGCRPVIYECLDHTLYEDYASDVSLPALALAGAAGANGSAALLDVAQAIARRNICDGGLFYSCGVESKRAYGATLDMLDTVVHVLDHAGKARGCHYPLWPEPTDGQRAQVLERAVDALVAAVADRDRAQDGANETVQVGVTFGALCHRLANVVDPPHHENGRLSRTDGLYYKRCAVAALGRIAGVADSIPGLERWVAAPLFRVMRCCSITDANEDGLFETLVSSIPTRHAPAASDVEAIECAPVAPSVGPDADILTRLVEHEFMIVTDVLLAYLDDCDTIAMARCNRHLLAAAAYRMRRQRTRSMRETDDAIASAPKTIVAEMPDGLRPDDVAANFCALILCARRMMQIEAAVERVEHAGLVCCPAAGQQPATRKHLDATIAELWTGTTAGLGRVLNEALFKGMFSGSPWAIMRVLEAARRLEAVRRSCLQSCRYTVNNAAQFSYSANYFAASNASSGIAERSARGTQPCTRLLVWMEVTAFSTPASTPETSQCLLDPTSSVWFSVSPVAYVAGRLRSPGLFSFALTHAKRQTRVPSTFCVFDTRVSLAADAGEPTIDALAACILAAALGVNHGFGLDTLEAATATHVGDTDGFLSQLCALFSTGVATGVPDGASRLTLAETVAVLLLMAKPPAPDVRQLREAAVALARTCHSDTVYRP